MAPVVVGLATTGMGLSLMLSKRQSAPSQPGWREGTFEGLVVGSNGHGVPGHLHHIRPNESDRIQTPPVSLKSFRSSNKV